MDTCRDCCGREQDQSNGCPRLSSLGSHPDHPSHSGEVENYDGDDNRPDATPFDSRDVVEKKQDDYGGQHQPHVDLVEEGPVDARCFVDQEAEREGHEQEWDSDPMPPRQPNIIRAEKTVMLKT